MRLLPQRFLATPARRLLARVVFYGAAVFLGLPFAFSQVMIGAIRRPAGTVASGYEVVRLRSQGIVADAGHGVPEEVV